MSIIAIHNLLLIRRRIIDLNNISGKNLSERLVNLMQEFRKSVAKTSNKMRKSKTLDEATIILFMRIDGKRLQMRSIGTRTLTKFEPIPFCL